MDNDLKEAGAGLYAGYLEKEQAVDIRLLLYLIRAEVPAATIQQLLAADGPVDWSYITSLSVRHQVAAIFYFNLRKLGLAERLPETVRRELKARYLAAAGGNLRFRSRLAELAGVLEESGVPVVPFKGPVLAQAIYGDSSLRQSQDLDLLVPAEKVAVARDALQAAGYRPLNLWLNREQLRVFVRFNKALDLVDRRGQTLLDLHWRLTMHTRRWLDYDFCRERLVPMEWDGRRLDCLSAEDMVVYLCVHGTSHVWDSLGAVLWVAEYVDRHPDLDWELVMGLADALGCRRMVRLGLFLARDMFAVSVPETVVAWIAKDKAVKELAGQVYGRLFSGKASNDHFQWRMEEAPFQFKVRDSWSAKGWYLIWRLFWPTQKDWRIRPLPAKLAFLYFVLRPAGLVAELAAAKVGKVLSFKCLRGF